MPSVEIMTQSEKVDTTGPAGSTVDATTGVSNEKTLPASVEKGIWTIGLINSSYKYLSAETFGFEINVHGKAMKKKQCWVMEPYGDGDCICLRSHLQKFLAVDQFGNVTCTNEEKDEASKFEISVCDDLSGRWAFKSVSRGYFLGASSPDTLTCSAKSPGDSELWFVNLAARPQVNLRNVARKRFARLNDEQTDITVDEAVPWGSNTLFTLEFREEINKYLVHSMNDMYLTSDGKLVPELSKECSFTCEYHGGYLSLRDQAGLYLAPIGSRAVLMTKSKVVTKEELFSLEDSLPQAAFQSVGNKRYLSTKQGELHGGEIMANQEEISDNETFQLEFDSAVAKWFIRTMKDKYFGLQAGSGIQAVESQRSAGTLLELIWLKDGTVAMKADNGKYVGTKKSGNLFANVETVDESCKYYFNLINRPVLVLKGEQGFVGYRAAGNLKLQCNKATYAAEQVEKAEDGQVYLKGHNGDYWNVTDEGIFCNGKKPQGFYLELREPHRMCIKTAEGKYLMEQKNGDLAVEGTDGDNATRWEY